MTRATLVFSAVLIAIGVVVFAETALLGGGIGFLVGVLFVVAGGLRIYLLRR